MAVLSLGDIAVGMRRDPAQARKQAGLLTPNRVAPTKAGPEIRHVH